MVENKSSGGLLFSKAVGRSEAFGTVDQNRSIVVSLPSQTRYTFLVQPEEPQENELINLIILHDQNNTQEYFIKYEFNDYFESRIVSTNGDMSSFSGKVSYFDGNGNLTGEYSIENGMTTSRNVGSGTPCPPDDDDDNNEENNDNTNGGGGCIEGATCDDDNQGSDGNDDGSGGWLEDPDEPCGMVWSYEVCCQNVNNAGTDEPHDAASCGCGQGNLNTLTVTNTCASETWVRSRNSGDLDPVDCDNTVGIIFGVKKECKKITEFLDDADNANFKQKLLEYSSPLNAAQYLDVNFEFSTTIHEFHTGIEERQGDPNTRSADVSYTMFHSNRIKGWVHTHNNGVGVNGTYSIFSFEDLIAMSKWLNNDKIKSDKFVAFLITKKGNNYTRYAMTINDKNKFKEFFSPYQVINFSSLSNEGKSKLQESSKKSYALRDKYYDHNNARIKAQNVNQEQIMKEFLALMSESNMGVSLFKADETFSNFTQVTLKNPSEGSASDVKERECN